MKVYDLKKKEIEPYILSQKDLFNWDLLVSNAEYVVFGIRSDSPGVNFKSSLIKVLETLNTRIPFYRISFGFKSEPDSLDTVSVEFKNQAFEYDPSTETFKIRSENELRNQILFGTKDIYIKVSLSNLVFVKIIINKENSYFLRIFNDNNITCKWCRPTFADDKTFELNASYSSFYRGSFAGMIKETKKIIDFMISHLNNPEYSFFEPAVLHIRDSNNAMSLKIKNIIDVSADDHSISINFDVDGNRKLVRLTDISLLKYSSFIITFPIPESLLSSVSEETFE